jgi:hypothetical protein
LPFAAVVIAAASACTLVNNSHVISLQSPRVPAGRPYKSDFADLARVLSSPAYERRRILATFDPVVYEWWIGLHGRFASVADPFLSTRPDAEIEARFMALCDEVGMPGGAFEKLVANKVIQVYWLSYDKYNVSPLHHYGEKSDYSSAAQDQMRTSAITLGWNIVVPKSELSRLADAYRRSSWKARRITPPDILVLSKDEVAQGRKPRDPKFRESFSNGTFVVWVRS